MRFIKLGIISVLFFCLLIIAISLLLPSQIVVSRAIDVNASREKVYENISNVGNWKNWYQDYDPANSKTSAATTGKGAYVTVNKTTITLQEVSPNKVKAMWQMGDNTPLPGEFNIFSQDSASHVTVQWQFFQKVKWYPWQKFALIMSDKAVGPFMEKSLDKLKIVSEQP